MAETTHSPKNVLITGGAGFIGANLVYLLLDTDPNIRVVNLDALTYAGNPDNLSALSEETKSRHRFVHGDICDNVLVEEVLREENIDTIIHLAAESHVDRSIDGPADFVHTNVMGTYTLLEVARSFWGERKDVRFHHVSTDEVFGSLGESGFFTEDTPYDPSSPYSATKAGSDHLVRAWARTFGLPISVSNCSNNYGPYQFPEKLLPLMINNALDEKPLPVYGDGSNIRDWLYVIDHCRAIDRIIRCGKPGCTYNVGGFNEWKNIDIVNLLCTTLDEIRPRQNGAKYKDLITFVKDRPGHDMRYAIDASRIKNELGWTPDETFETGLRKTIEWYLDHEAWMENIRSGGYRGERLGLSE